jgi:hypothetical protein
LQLTLNNLRSLRPIEDIFVFFCFSYRDILFFIIGLLDFGLNHLVLLNLNDNRVPPLPGPPPEKTSRPKSPLQLQTARFRSPRFIPPRCPPHRRKSPPRRRCRPRRSPRPRRCWSPGFAGRPRGSR